MGYKLVIAEKDVLAKDIASALIGKSASLPARGKGWCVCAASGHLLELVEPEAYDPRLAQAGKWDITDLPIRFDDWKKDVKLERVKDASGKYVRVPSEFAEKRLAQIGKLLEDADEVYHAGDPDDAGQVIVDEILERFGWDGPVWRVYVNDSIAKNILRAFDEKVDNASERCRGAYNAEYAREMADFTFGINESRLISRRLHAGNLSLGRVKTPTLGLVVERDEAIAAHRSRAFWTLEGTGLVVGAERKLAFSPPRELLEDGKRCFERDALEEARSEIERDLPLAAEASTRRELKEPPLPYNITTLETDMSKRFGYSVERTLEISQSLRTVHKAITYNRTDSSYLKTGHWQEAERVLGVACANIGFSAPLDFSLRSKAFDDSKVPDHHGIIPTEADVDVSRMAEEERNVYRAIVERYAAQFLPPAEYDVLEVCAPVAGGTLKHKARRLVSGGWLDYLGSPDGKKLADGGDLPPMPDGPCEIASAELDVKEGKTSPPKPYTPGTLVADMASIAKYCTDPEVKRILKLKDASRVGDSGSIGTSATRPDAIASLKEMKLIEERDGKVRSTKLGREVWHIVPNDIRRADLTAKWWLIQEDVRAGKIDRNDVAKSVCEQFMKHRDTAYIGVPIPEALASKGATIVGKCPRCGSPVKLTRSLLTCTSNIYAEREGGKLARTGGCGWCVWASVGAKPGKKLTERQAASILSGKATRVDGIPTKNGKSAAAVSLGPDEGGDAPQRLSIKWPSAGKRPSSRKPPERRPKR